MTCIAPPRNYIILGLKGESSCLLFQPHLHAALENLSGSEWLYQNRKFGAFPMKVSASCGFSRRSRKASQSHMPSQAMLHLRFLVLFFHHILIVFLSYSYCALSLCNTLSEVSLTDGGQCKERQHAYSVSSIFFLLLQAFLNPDTTFLETCPRLPIRKEPNQAKEGFDTL